VSRFRYTESIKAFLFMSGWIKVHRKVQDHWIFKEQREFSRFEAWLDMLLCANHSEQQVIIQGVIYTVKPGESLHSLETWAKRWNWSKSKVKRFFDTLTKELMIVTTNETKTTRITICNYASYQVERNADETRTKRKRNADETQTEPNKNEENENNDKETFYRVIKHLKLTEEEFKSLSIDYHKNQIDDILDQIENYKNNKNYTSLYLTAKNWLKKAYPVREVELTQDQIFYNNVMKQINERNS
jgi:hypothetical protein